MDLTVQDVHAFVEAINRGRVAAGLDPVSRIEFDESEPGHTGNCLSARHLFRPALDAEVLLTTVNAYGSDQETRRAVAEALGVAARRQLDIPLSILRVTDVFDACKPSYNYDVSPPEKIIDREKLAKLRALFVEAGYVEGASDGLH